MLTAFGDTPARGGVLDVNNVGQVREMFGDSADRLIHYGFDFGALRPFVGDDGKSYITIRNKRTGKSEVVTTNAPATLSYDSWKVFDDVVLKVLRQRLRAMADIRAAGLEYNLPNGMAHTLLQYQTQSDMTDAMIGMDPVTRSESDAPTTATALFPLPLIWKDFDFTLREIQVSRQGNMPLDTSSAETSSRKVAEAIEKLTTGLITFAYAGASIYGMTSLPQRSTSVTMTVPTGTNGVTNVSEILALRQMLITNMHYGPYRLYMSTQWAQFLDNQYSTTYGDRTLRERLLAIDGIQDVTILDYLPNTKYDVVLMEMDTQTVRAVIGLDVMTIQWESLGGMQKHFKIIAMVLPQFRPDSNGNSGVAHGRTP